MKKVVMIVLCAWCWLWGVALHAASVPQVLNFQSMLFDDGGNPIPDGTTPVTFRVTDVAGAVLYEEHQSLDVVRGAVSAMVGNGLDANGAPTGGVPLDALQPDEGRYLEVIADGFTPQASMEIASVPYALYAQKAVGAVDGAITGDAIAAGALRAEHFAKDALKEIGDTLAAGGGVISASGMQSAQGARGMGVESGFAFSGSTTVQGVLADLDRAIGQRATHEAAVATALDQERAERQAADQDIINNSVSSTGDTINGNIAVCGDTTINCGGDLIVNQTNIAQQIQQTQTMLNETRAYFGGLKVIASGSVNDDCVMTEGRNAQMGTCTLSSGTYEVRFVTQPSDAQYLVMVTVQYNGVSPALASVAGKSAASFTVKTASVAGGSVKQSFDFVVLDAQ